MAKSPTRRFFTHVIMIGLTIEFGSQKRGCTCDVYLKKYTMAAHLWFVLPSKVRSGETSIHGQLSPGVCQTIAALVTLDYTVQSPGKGFW